MSLSKYRHLSVFSQPRCLISTDNDGKLEVDDEVLNEFSNIEERLVVVAIAGIYRTGKSFLMNRLANSNSGFPLGKTIESKTKGIWAWCRIHPTQENTVLVLLDTEGLGDVKKGDTNHDNKVLTISAMMCNVLCYNILSAFDQDAVERLAFLSSAIRRHQNAISPELLVCVRDFHLDLENTSQDAYLESGLQLIDGICESVEQRNRSRSSIKNCFKRRKCCTFDRPTEDRKKIKCLEQITEAELNPEFLEDARKFEKHIYERTPCSAHTINGQTFELVTKHLVECIGKGEVVEMHDAVQKASRLYNEQIVHSRTRSFKEVVENIGLPVFAPARLEMLCNNQLEESLTMLRKEVRYDDDKIFERQALEEMQKIIDETKQNNSKQIQEYCTSKLYSFYNTSVGAERNYYRLGGHIDYRSAITSFKTSYREQCSDADRSLRESALQTFMDSKTGEDTRIRAEDKRITAEDDKRKKEALRLEQERQRQEDIRLYEKRKREEEETRERHRREQENYFRERERRRLEMERKIRLEREECQKRMRLLQEEQKREQALRVAERRRLQEEARREQEQLEKERREEEAKRTRREELGRLERSMMFGFNRLFIRRTHFYFCPICGRLHFL